MNRTNELVRAVKARQQATVPEYASACRPWKTHGWGGKVRTRLRHRGEKVHSGSTSLAGRSGAAYGNQSTEGKCQLGYVIGLTPAMPYFAMDIQVYPKAGKK